jgi:TolB-like protein/Flp pilus assembly protein TadD
MIGTRFGQFEITAKLGEGGMGVVYEAFDSDLDRKVAVKVLPAMTTEDPHRLERFRREARAVAALNHPNIVTIHGIESGEGKHFLVMELVEGQSLDRLIGEKGLPLRRMFDLAIPIADALSAAHAKGVVHRDIKPANVMVTPDGLVKVLDFGLAKAAIAPMSPEDGETHAATRTTPLTGEGVIVGTAPYMSPEQLQGHEVDQRGDIFSLGVVLFEMVTGKRPFEGESRIALASSILKDTPDSVSELRADMPRQLGRIIKQCLEKDPDRRFQTVRDVRNQLESLQQEILSGESQASGVRRASPAPRWGRIAVGILGLVAIVLAVVAWRARAPSSPTAPAGVLKIVVLPFENQGEPDDEYFADGMTDEITTRLAAMKGLAVISRASAMQFKKARPALSEIGAQLGVDYVLDGRVRWQRASDGTSTVRVTPELVRIAEDTQVWTESYVAVLANIFEVQANIARKVSEELGLTLLEPARVAGDSRATANLEAYDVFLRANEYFHRGAELAHGAEYQIAARLYDQVVELDPEYALAHARRAMAHEVLYSSYVDHTPERLAQVRQAVERALELDPDLPEAHHAKGLLYMAADRDDERALAEFRLVLASQPSAEAYASMSTAQENLGMWDESEASILKSLDLDPLAGEYACAAGGVKLNRREFREALELHDRALQLIPDRWCPYYCKAAIYLSWDGDTARARRFLEQLPPDLPLEDSPPINLPWFWAEMFDGHYDEALKRLESGDAAVFQFGQYFIPKDLLIAKIHRLAGPADLARQHYEAARQILERKIAEDPSDTRLHGPLGIAYAGLGRREDAVREAALVRDGSARAQGQDRGWRLRELAEIHLLLGDLDQAVEYLERVLNSPSFFAAASVKIDPTWTDLRGHPRFVSMLEDHGG